MEKEQKQTTDKSNITTDKVDQARSDEAKKLENVEEQKEKNHEEIIVEL